MGTSEPLQNHHHDGLGFFGLAPFHILGGIIQSVLLELAANQGIDGLFDVVLIGAVCVTAMHVQVVEYTQRQLLDVVNFVQALAQPWQDLLAFGVGGLRA